MAEQTRVGIIGAGWPGKAHAKGYQEAGGFKIVAVSDLIPDRRKALMAEFSIGREYADANDLLADKEIDVVSIGLPNDLHAPIALAALRAGKHVVIEPPPGLSARDAKSIDTAATRAGKIVLYAFQRRFGPHEQSARQAILKGFAGEVYHVRSVWTRTRGIPMGTGWFTNKARAGGGALADIGLHMLDLAWSLLGQPVATSAYGVTHRRFQSLIPPEIPYDVEDSAFAIVRFENGKSLELASSWALNQPPHQNGTMCRVYGDKAAIEVYTPGGAILYQNFQPTGEAKEHPLKPPKTTHHTALMRHLKECLAGKATPQPGPREGLALMHMLEAIYKSAETGKSVTI